MLSRHHQLGCHNEFLNAPTSLPSIKLLDQPLPATPNGPSLFINRAGALSSVATEYIAFGPAGREDSLGVNPNQGKRRLPGPDHTHIDSAISCRPNRSPLISADFLGVLSSIQFVPLRSKGTEVSAETVVDPLTAKVRGARQYCQKRAPKDSITDPLYSRLHPVSSPSIEAGAAQPAVVCRQTRVTPGAFSDVRRHQTPAPATAEGTIPPGIPPLMFQRRWNCRSRDPPRGIILPRWLRRIEDIRIGTRLPYHTGPQRKFLKETGGENELRR